MIVTRTELGFIRRLGMKGTIKVLAVWTLGLAVLLGSTGVGWAYKPGTKYCACMCGNATGSAQLSWEIVAHCSVNGMTCRFNNPNHQGRLEQGKLSKCATCEGYSKTELRCGPDVSSAAPSSGLRPSREGTLELKTPMPRGIEGQPSVEGVEGPVEQAPAETPSGK